jgi:hypothetical protein
MTATQILHAAAGAPDYPATHAGDCRLCGARSTTGIPFAAWVKPTFTNFDMLRPGELICTACQFSVDDNSTLLQARMGKDKPQRMRNYSHFVVDGAWQPMHKGMKSEMLAALRANPQVAVIAVSGQKHIAFRARPGWWQIEESVARPTLATLEACLGHVQALYRIFSKGEIQDDQPIPHRMMQYAQKYGMASLLEAQQALRPHRGAIAFELAIFLAQKEEEDGTERLPDAVPHGAAPADPALERAGQQLQEQVRKEHLAAIRGQHPQRGLHLDAEPILQQSLWQVGDSD